MIKQKITPLYAKYDIVNSEMPEVFLDPTCKVQIYLYETNQEFDQIFLDENNNSVRLVEFKKHSTLDCWIAQNFSKQINPFQDSSVSKTIAMQNELELYILESVKSLIEKKFYFFTFEEVTQENVKTVNKYLIKENVDNFDKLKFRFSKLKAWLLSSVLIKNFQYWEFIISASDLGRKKYKKITLKIPSSSGFGNLRIEGNNNLGDNPQEVDYTLQSISHPFYNLEPVAVNFSYKNAILNTQLLHWDYFGKCMNEIRNYTFSVGALNQWGTMDFSRLSYGTVAYMPGAIFNPAAPTGAQYGLAEAYCSKLKDKTNDIKQYMWAKETYWGRQQREYWNLKKTNSTISNSFFEQFLKNPVATGSFTPYWNQEWDTDTLGNLFYTFQLNVLNEDNFNLSNEVADLETVQPGNYCWMICGQLNFYDIGIFSKKTGNQNTLLNPEYYTFGVPPFGFLSTNKMKTILNTIRTNSKMSDILITIELSEPTYLNNIKFMSVLADNLELQLIDESDQVTTYKTATSFYLLGQDKICTTINFF